MERLRNGHLRRLNRNDLQVSGLDDKTIDRLVRLGLLLEPVRGEYTTPHAELVRKLVNLSLRPRETLPLEWLILGPLESHLPDFSAYKVDDLVNPIVSFLEWRGIDHRMASRIADAIVKGLKSAGITGLSRYQYIMIEGILKGRWPLVAVLTAPTGSGKTLIFTVVAVAHALAEKAAGSSRPTVLMIYPRKALARDQLQRLATITFFINAYLDAYNIKNYNREPLRLTLGILDGDSPYGNRVSEAKELKEKPIRGILLEAGLPVECKYKLHEKRLETRCYDQKGQEIPYKLVSDLRAELEKEPPDMLITNCSMLEYHINPLIKKRRYARLFKNPTLIIIDEAHAYTGPEKVLVASLIHRLFLEKSGGNLDYLYNEAKRHAIILSSATITTVHQSYQNTGEARNAFLNDTRKFAGSLLPAGLLERFKVWRHGDPLVAEAYELVEEKSSKKGKRRLSFILLLMPRPSSASSTLIQEATLATLVWSLALRHGRAGRRWRFIVFFDNKDDLERVNEWIKEIIVQGRCEHCDRLGVPDGNIVEGGRLQCPVRASLSTEDVKSEWRDYIAAILGEKLSKLDFDFYAYRPDAFEKLAQDHRLWVSLAALVSDASPKAKIRKLVVETCKYSNHVGVHHADLKRKEREQIEDKLKRGDLLGLLSTQTLELGIDISDVSVILQYKPPRSAENFVQRIGRAGRSADSLYTSLGILILSHIDVPYLDQRFAFRRLLEIRPVMPPYKNLNLLIALAMKYTAFQALIKNDNETLDALNILTSLLEGEVAVRRTKAFKDIVKVVRKLYNYKNEVVTLIRDLIGNTVDSETLEEVFKLMINEIDEILKPRLTSDEALQLRDQVHTLREFVNNAVKECIKSLSQELRQYSQDLINQIGHWINEMADAVNQMLKDIEIKADECARGSWLDSSCEVVKPLYHRLRDVKSNRAADQLGAVASIYRKRDQLCTRINYIDTLFKMIGETGKVPDGCGDILGVVRTLNDVLSCMKKSSSWVRVG